ncbi:VTT domain-containing protein [Clostridia bacterium OttesenSCG-928-O13]|nr:VTT domain-containing protein [Clostridia bacterium OttesenSCG-928-O13]
MLYKHRKVLVVVLVVAAILALLPFARGLSVEKMLNYTPSSPLLAAVVLVLVYCLKSVVMVLPSYGLYIVGGMLFPAPVAILVAYIGLAGEMSLGFLLGRWLGQDKVNSLVDKHPKAKQFMNYLTGNSQYVCFLTRLLPMPYPVDLGSMVFGASGMKYGVHLLFSLLGFTAVMVPFTLAGGNIQNPLSAQFLVPFGISIGISVVLLLVYRAWSKRRGQKPGEAPEQKQESEE